MPRDLKCVRPDYVTIVSGLPRSGTSMMMQILRAGGMVIASDGLRAADEDNPRGYYELEAVKELPATSDASWLAALRGKAVKIIQALLVQLPKEVPCRLILMRRRLEEVVVSQRMMLERLGTPVGIDDENMVRIYTREVDRFDRWLVTQTELRVLRVSYNDLIAGPALASSSINDFLDGRLNVGHMTAAVDESLYRCRQDAYVTTSASCAAG